jgi:protein phosphatase
MNIKIPELSLVVLIGASGAGKSTFARKHFLPTETLSSDFCRGLVSDDESSLDATNDAFDVLHYIAGKRLAAGRLTVVDATNVQASARQPLVALARDYHMLPVAIVLNVAERVCLERNTSRPNRDFGPHVVRSHVRSLRQSLRNLKREGFRHIIVLESAEEIDSVTIEREPLYNNKKGELGPFDIIGDVHGCRQEMESLLIKLGYIIEAGADGAVVTPPTGRKAVFLGDLVDRGPDVPGVLRLVMGMV